MIRTFVYDNLYNIHDTADLFSGIFRYLPEIQAIYPNIHDWFDNTVIPDLKTSKRLLVSIYSKEKSCGYMILKNSTEQKICTLQIYPEFRNKKFASKLLQFALNTLSNPVITVSEKQLSMYSSLLGEYNFTQLEVKKNLYIPGVNEHIFKYVSN